MLLQDYQFKSCFSKYIEELIEQKHNCGYTYDSAKYCLIQFDKFCISENIDVTIVTKDLTQTWTTYIEKESKSRRSYRISILRQLALYMSTLDCNCYIPSKFTAKDYKMPYIMTDEEIRAFMKVVDAYTPKNSGKRFLVLAEIYKVLFRFIYCCGLRVSEARNLKIQDIDFDKCTAILKHSKGDKDRLVYFANDVGKMCQGLIQLLHQQYNVYSDFLFPSSTPESPLQAQSINSKFREFWSQTSYARADKYPTVHSLRYSFVVARMNRWMECGEQMNALMPYLSKYLGHSSVEDTYYYYHQIEAAFKIVRQKDALSTQIIPEVTHEE